MLIYFLFFLVLSTGAIKWIYYGIKDLSQGFSGSLVNHTRDKELINIAGYYRDGHVFMMATRTIFGGTELLYDYIGM